MAMTPDGADRRGESDALGSPLLVERKPQQRVRITDGRECL